MSLPFPLYFPEAGDSYSESISSYYLPVSSIPVVLFVPVKLPDLFHLIVRQFKTEQVEVFPDMISIARTGDHDDAALQIPAKDDLRGRYFVGFRNGFDRFVPQQIGSITSSPQRIPAIALQSPFHE